MLKILVETIAPCRCCLVFSSLIVRVYFLFLFNWFLHSLPDFMRYFNLLIIFSFFFVYFAQNARFVSLWRSNCAIMNFGVPAVSHKYCTRCGESNAIFKLWRLYFRACVCICVCVIVNAIFSSCMTSFFIEINGFWHRKRVPRGSKTKIGCTNWSEREAASK